jgi:TonB family protein
MPITELPNNPPPVREPETGPGLPPPRNNSDYGDLGTDELVQRINELEDERRAARIREGIWVALLVHAIFVLLWVYGPRYVWHEPVVVNPAEKFEKPDQLAYLHMPPDVVPPIKPKHPQALSDKNRVQSSPNPVPDQKTLEQLQAMRRAGSPAPQAQAPQQQKQAQAPPPQAPQQQQAPQKQQAQAPPQTQTPTPSPVQPPLPQRQAAQQPAQNPFKTSDSAADMIRNAARGAAKPSNSGDYGANAPSRHGGVAAGADILSDTMGVDFGPYMERVIAATKAAWYPIIPQSARPPLNNKGKVGIEFIIAPDGSVKKMVLKFPSGDVALDRAAWGGITGASPYPPLPKEFKGPYLALRFGFYYNIDPDTDK